MDKAFRIKDIKEVDKLSTKRLLSYYKSRRKEKISFVASHTCDCCGEATWDLYPNDKEEIIANEQYTIISNHLKEVKELLSKREHIKR